MFISDYICFVISVVVGRGMHVFFVIDTTMEGTAEVIVVIYKKKNENRKPLNCFFMRFSFIFIF